MIKLLYEGEKTLEFKLTMTPISNPQESPEPTGHSVESLDPKAYDYNQKKKLILEHPNYSENETVLLRPGINEFENEEQAEYIYRELGNPVDGGSVPVGSGKTASVVNNNVLHEAEEVEEEIEGEVKMILKKVEGPLHIKYRVRSGVQIHQTYDKSAFELPKENK